MEDDYEKNQNGFEIKYNLLQNFAFFCAFNFDNRGNGLLTDLSKIENRLIQQVREDSLQLLSQTSYSADFLYNLTTSFGLMLLNDSDIVRVMYSDAISVEDLQLINMKLSKMISSNPAIQSVYIYNKKLNRYLTDLPTNQPVQEFDQDFKGDLPTILQKQFQFIPRTISYINDIRTHQTYVLTEVFSEFSTHDVDGSVIVNVNESYLRNLINSMNTTGESKVLVVDQAGTIISHPDSTQVVTQVPHFFGAIFDLQ